jgi:uncharacterized protein (TIGR03083 family)
VTRRHSGPQYLEVIMSKPTAGADAATWTLIHNERAAMADTLATLTPAQWSAASLCGGWSVHQAAAHIVAGAEQTTGRFVRGLASSGFRFNTMIERDVRRVAVVPPAEIINRLRATTTTTNRPPAPVMTMLGEVVVHGEDIRRPLGLNGDISPTAVAACLDMYKDANFPTGAKKRIAGLRLVATDTDWSLGSGPEVTGTGLSLLMAMTGRAAGLSSLAGGGIDTLRSRMTR